MENIIYNELIYRGYSVNVGVVIINSKNENNVSTRTQLEVDFVATEGSKNIIFNLLINCMMNLKLNKKESHLLILMIHLKR